MKYRISDLENFVETAKCATMAMASKRLEITQPSLSESIKRLESDLSVILFYRSRSGIQLTPNGKILLESAKAALSSLLYVESLNENHSSFKGRSITIGCHTTVASYTLPMALETISKKIPDYRIQLKHGTSRDIQSLVQEGKVDIGIVINPNPVPDLILKKLGSDKVHVWNSPGKKIPNKLICNTEIFQTQSILKKWKNHPGEIIETDSFELTIKLVEKGIGYGIIPERAVNMTGTDLVKCKHLPSYDDVIGLIYRPEFGKNPFEKETVKAIVQVFDI